MMHNPIHQAYLERGIDLGAAAAAPLGQLAIPTGLAPCIERYGCGRLKGTEFYKECTRDALQYCVGKLLTLKPGRVVAPIVTEDAPPPEPEDKTLTYVAIGAGVLVVGGVAYYLATR